MNLCVSFETSFNIHHMPKFEYCEYDVFEWKRTNLSSYFSIKIN